MRTLKSIYSEILTEAPWKGVDPNAPQPMPAHHPMRLTPLGGDIKAPLPPDASMGQRALDFATTDYDLGELANYFAHYVKQVPGAAWQWLNGLLSQMNDQDAAYLKDVIKRHNL